MCRAVWMIQARGNSGTPGHAPLVHGGRKGFLRRLFGQVEVAHQPDQGRDDPAPIGAIDRFDRPAGIRRHAYDGKYFVAGCRFGRPPFDIPLEGRKHEIHAADLPGRKGASSEAEREHCYVESRSYAQELSANGQYLAAAPLQPTSTATSVRMRDGKRLVTDGPFAETREQLGGYFLIEASDLDEAIGIAARIPGARWGTVEVRPVMEIPNLPGPSKSKSEGCGSIRYGKGEYSAA